MRYTIGVDFGTESGQAVIVDITNGRELASSVHEYANGVIDEVLPRTNIAIPCGGFSVIRDESIGKIVVESIGGSAAVLLKNHGVFTIGKNAEAAVKAAVMTEENARTVWLALRLGVPDEIPPEDVEKLHYRYTNVYGQ